MSNLDKKLRETLHKVGTVKIRSALDEVIEDGVAQIKQAFAEEGYVTPENAKKVQEIVNQMANLANDAFRIPIIQYIKPNKAMTKAQNLMTGQEWYNRFVAELDKDGEIAIAGSGIIKGAAKRAAGLEEENKE